MTDLSVGVYFDGFNVYYGGRKLFGRGEPEWKWYSPRAVAACTLQHVLTSSFASTDIKQRWENYSIDRVVLCTAKISQDRDQQAHYDQLAFINAVERGKFADHIELGHYVARVKYAPLAIVGHSGSPEVVTPEWPVKVQDECRNGISNATFMVSYFHSEEKGSDVNLATHLLKDTFEQRIDAAIVFSNDSDLSLPVEVARTKIPIGIVNPFGNRSHHSLTKTNNPSHGDWYTALRPDFFTQSQMPTIVDNVEKPAGW